MGDNLGNDDVYLNMKRLDEPDAYSDGHDDGDLDKETVAALRSNILIEDDEKVVKRKHEFDKGQVELETKRKRNRKTRQASIREIAFQSQSIQANYLWECSTKALTNNLPNATNLGRPFDPSCIRLFDSKNERNDNKMSDHYKSLLSMKKLKKWRIPSSPMVVVICISARRCVSVRKALIPMKVKCGKLFAKHLDIDEQKCMLQSQKPGIVVGTPNRIRKLCVDGSLSFSSTELIVIDGQEINGAVNVCTLNDTSTDLFSLLKEYVQCEWKVTTDTRSKSGERLKLALY